MTKLIPLTKGQSAIVDDADFDWLSQWKWCFIAIKRHTGYAVRHGSGNNKKLIYMHRFIMNAPDGVQIDHKNICGIDNQRSNLRFATVSQNNANTRPRGKHSPYKGVYPQKLKWIAVIGKTRIGSFTSETDAALAYNQAAILQFGEFARLNIIEGTQP